MEPTATRLYILIGALVLIVLLASFMAIRLRRGRWEPPTDEVTRAAPAGLPMFPRDEHRGSDRSGGDVDSCFKGESGGVGDGSRDATCDDRVDRFARRRLQLVIPVATEIGAGSLASSSYRHLSLRNVRGRPPGHRGNAHRPRVLSLDERSRRPGADNASPKSPDLIAGEDTSYRCGPFLRQFESCP
jgi:hypothetical protein